MGDWEDAQERGNIGLRGELMECTGNVEKKKIRQAPSGSLPQDWGRDWETGLET